MSLIPLFLQSPPGQTPDVQIFGFLFDQIGKSVTEFANEGAAALIGYLGPTAVVLLTIYVLLWGVAMAAGQISEPFTDGMKRIIRMCIIVGFALTAGIYQSTVVDLFQRAPANIANVMTGGSNFASDYDDTNDLANMLDNTVSNGFRIGGSAWKQGEEHNATSKMVGFTATGVTYQVLAILVCLISLLIVGVAGGIIFVAFLAMSILLAIGPLFIMMAIFPSQQRWLEMWMGQTVNFALLFILEALTCSLLFKMIDDYINMLDTFGPGVELHDVLMICLRVVGLTIVCIAILSQMSGIASALAGGASIQAANVTGKLAGMGMDMASGAASGARTAVRGAVAFAYGAKGKSFDSQRTDAEWAGRALRRGVGMARRTFGKGNEVKKDDGKK